MSDEEKAEAPKITRKLVFRAFSYLGPYKAQLFVILLTILVTSLLALLPIMLQRDIVDKGFLGQNNNLLVSTDPSTLGSTFTVTATDVSEAYEFHLTIVENAEPLTPEDFVTKKIGTPTETTAPGGRKLSVYKVADYEVSLGSTLELTRTVSNPLDLIRRKIASTSAWSSNDPTVIAVQPLRAGDLSLIVWLISLSFALMILSGLIGILQSYVNTWMSQHIVFDMRNQMFRHLEFMSHRFFTNEKQGDLITRMTSDVQGVNQVISGTLINLFSNFVTLITTIIAMVGQNWILTLVGVAILPLLIFPTRAVGRKRFEIAGATQEAQDDMNQILNESLNVSGSLLVKLFTREEKEYAKFEETNTRIVRLSIRESIIGRWFMMFMQVLNNIGPTIIYLISAILLFKYGHLEITVGGIAAMVALVQRLYGPVNSLFSMQVDITRSMALFNRLFNYYDMPVEIQNKPDAVIPERVTGNIDFDNVSFHYNEDSPILKGVSFSIKSGTTTAIVGPSGAGKSTIINLIPRLYDTVGGSVRVDGTDLRDLDMFALRRNIGFVTQDTYMFNGSVRDNLLYAKDDATEDELTEACRKANIHDFIISLPEKYDTIVGNRGLKLSGGEKQRLSIARVILKNPKILLLDEATSSLDSISETMIQEAIDPLLNGRTGVVIAHRLSTIMEADEIIVLKDGEVQGRGTHRELLASNDVYKELYETQFKRAIEDYESARTEQLEDGAQSSFPEFMRGGRGSGERGERRGPPDGGFPGAPEGFDPSKLPEGFDPSKFTPPDGGFPGGPGGRRPGGGGFGQ
jgi:ATP-binding cassette subfamily B protein